MLHIFDQKELEREPDKKLTLNRLQQRLGPPPQVVEAPQAAAAAVAIEQRPAPEPVLAPPAPPPERRTAAPRAEAPAAPALSAVRLERRSEPSAPAESQIFAEQFTRSFLESVTRAVSDIHALVTEDRRRLEGVIDSLSKSAREAAGVHDGLAEVRRQVESLAGAQDELSSRLTKTEEYLTSPFGGGHGGIGEFRQAIEKRLELQAGVIRMMHSSLQSREERLDKLLATFQALHAATGEATPSRKLPDNL